jgi:hypothetical protein
MTSDKKMMTDRVFAGKKGEYDQATSQTSN